MVTIIKKGTKQEKLEGLLSKAMEVQGVNTRKYCGVIKLKEDALKIQKQLRNEWE